MQIESSNSDQNTRVVSTLLWCFIFHLLNPKHLTVLRVLAYADLLSNCLRMRKKMSRDNTTPQNTRFSALSVMIPF